MTRFDYKFLLLSFCLGLCLEVSSVSAQTTEEVEADEEKIELPHIYTFIDRPAEQKVTVTKEKIEQLQPASVPDLLEKSGIENLNYGGYGMQSSPQIRGFTGSTVKVVVDGVCVNSDQNGSFDLTTINVNDIEKLEIIRGGFNESLEGDGAVGGVIIITTKNAQTDFKINADVFTTTYFSSAKPLDALGASLGLNAPLGESTFFKLQARSVFAHNEFPFLNYRNVQKLRTNSRVFDGDVSANVLHYFGCGNSFLVSEKFYGGNKQCAGSETSTTPGLQRDYNNQLGIKINFPSVKYFGKVDGAVLWQSSNQFYDENFLLDSCEKSSHFLNAVTVQADCSEYSGKGFSLNGGGKLRLSFLNSTNDGNHFLAGGTLMAVLKYSTGTVENCPVQFDFSLPQSITFSGTNWAYVPKISGSLKFNSEQIVLSAYRMCLFPDMNQLYWGSSSFASGNPDLKPEDGWGAELSFNSENVFVPVSVNVFTNYYFNKIQWQNISGVYKPVNVASAFYAGADLEVHRRFFKYFDFSVSYEYLFNRLLAEGLTYGNRIMYTPEHTAAGSLSFSKDGWNACVNGQFTGSRYISNLNTSSMDPYFLLNANVSYTFKNRITLYARGNNLLNMDYECVPEYPMPGINMSVGVKYN